MMEKFKDFIITHSRLPAYLFDLLQTNEDILLVHCKKKLVEPCNVSVNLMDMSSNSTMNLTGCPLEVDLNVLPSSAAYYLSCDQDKDKVTHIPMTLETARKFIRDYKIHSKELISSPKTIYCVCDGNDNKRTGALGSYQSGGYVERTLCFLEDSVDESYIEDNINGMIQKHNDNVGTNDIKIESVVTCIYELYGFKLTNDYVLENIENTGSVLVEGSWNSRAYNIPRNGATLKMILQSVIGHEDSIMYLFFTELRFLQHCLTILSKNRNTLHDEIISHNSFDVTELNQKISKVLQEVNVVKPHKIPNNLEDAIEKVSELSLIDKLYDILKSCEKVGDLAICFGRLFELVCDAPVRLQLYDNDKHTVVEQMIQDISSGKMIVPYLSSEQSLELLIDLGMQKLKRNYFSIVKYFDLTIGEQLVQNWNDIGTFLIESRRGTFAGHDSQQGHLKLRFLLCVHVSLEFLQLVEKNCCFSRGASVSVMKYAYQKYVTKSTPIKLSMIETKQLCDLVVPLTFPDFGLIENCTPMKWQIKMTSVQENSSVTTIFHYSKRPIFPNTVCENDDADVSSADIKQKFFVARLERYSDKIF